jgi:hypothetical protein
MVGGALRNGGVKEDDYHGKKGDSGKHKRSEVLIAMIFHDFRRGRL